MTAAICTSLSKFANRLSSSAAPVLGLLFGLSFGLCFSSLSLANTSSEEEITEEVITVKNPMVRIETSMGDIDIELFMKESPITVANFLKYVDEKFYDGTVIHRVVPGFVVQGGGYGPDFKRKATHSPIINESDNRIKNVKGSLSMARTSDPNSATSQFFINLQENMSLDYFAGRQGYAVFGKITKGFNIAKKIEREPRGAHQMFPEAPNNFVFIKKAYRLKAE